MYDPALRDAIEGAVARVETTLAERVPVMAKPVCRWMRQLSGSKRPAADYFLHPSAFPIFLLPWWVEEALGVSPCLPLQEDIAYSSANAYYSMRLIDNIMDGDAEEDVLLLPALTFFFLELQSVYSPRFPGDHAFWDLFSAYWLRSGEAAMEDSALTELDEEKFRTVAAQKTCAVKIPVAAVCYFHDQPGQIPAWYGFIDVLGCWHQMMNDLFDWQRDLAHDNSTFFLSEGRRQRAPDEDLASWVMRQGFEWGSGLLHGWMQEMQTMAEGLASCSLLAYLKEREAMHRRREAKVLQGLRGAADLLSAIRQEPAQADRR